MIDPAALRPGERFMALVRIGDEGTLELEVLASPTPGLVVHRPLQPKPPGDWCISHLRSGLNFGWHTDDPEGAMAFAAAVGGMADWTRSGNDLVRDEGWRTIRRKVDLVAESMGMKRRSQRRRPVDAYDVWPRS